MRRSNTETLGTAIERLIKAMGGDKKIKEIRLAKEWENIIGPNIFKATEKIYIQDNKVYLLLRSSIIKHELSLLKSEIIKRFNYIAKEKFIYDIVFL